MKRIILLLLSAVLLFSCSDDEDLSVPVRGLVAYYPFDGDAKDASGNGNDGVVDGAVLTADRKGKSNGAYHFGGYYDSNDIEVANSRSLNIFGELTVSLWFRLAGGGGMDGYGRYADDNVPLCLYDKDVDGVGFGLYVLYNSATEKITFSTGYSPYKFLNQYTVPQTFKIGEWIHLTVISGGDYDELYINGKSVLRQDKTVSPASNDYPLRIGRALGSFWYPFNGDIDDIRLYNRALSAAEIYALYNE
jgi:hypothetical protein